MDASDPQIRDALALDFSSSARERTVDISTLGRRSGQWRRIETWLYRAGEHNYLSSIPRSTPPAWYLNLVAEPRFTLHLKHGVHADLAASATPVTDEAERRRIFRIFVEDFNQPHNPARIAQPTRLEDWVARSPLMRIDLGR